MGRHEAPDTGATFAAIADDYATQRARELVAEFDAWLLTGDTPVTGEWVGAAAEILRELTRDA